MVDISLEKTQELELASQAQDADRNGQRLLQQHRANEAVDAFRKAHALERENPKYEIDLIQALMAAGKVAEAAPLMNELLELDSNDGEANLVAARLAAQQGQAAAADSYYHRSIYGGWAQSASQHRIAVRLELIHFLAARGKQEEVLAELLPLEEEASRDANLLPTLANLFLEAGSPSRASQIFRRLIKARPADPADYAGLGQAELALGDFRAARVAFASAVARDGQMAQWRDRLALATQLSNLDPTVRWLPSAEKYSRSAGILQMATGDLQQCIVNHPERATDQAAILVSAAQQKLSAPAPKQPTNEMAEATLGLAQSLWQARTSLCGTGTAADEEPLRWMMEKLAK
jgi:predicted Zn-dependent protease